MTPPPDATHDARTQLSSVPFSAARINQLLHSRMLSRIPSHFHLRIHLRHLLIHSLIPELIHSLRNLSTNNMSTSDTQHLTAAMLYVSCVYHSECKGMISKSYLRHSIRNLYCWLPVLTRHRSRANSNGIAKHAQLEAVRAKSIFQQLKTRAMSEAVKVK